MDSLRMLMSALVRKETLDGREYLVCPTILITEGVHNGELYPADELEKYPEAWDGRPVVLDHPTMHGRPISANKKEVLEQRKVGMLLNTKFGEWNLQGDGPKVKGLKSDVYLDVLKAQETPDGQRLLKSVKEGDNIEVSTGLFTDDKSESGEWNGEKYDSITVNFRPDHLAVLLDQKGACSWEDGAGMPRVNSDKPKQGWFDRLRSFLRRNAGEDKKELSLAERIRKLESALRDRFDGGQNEIMPSPGSAWPEEVFDDYAIVRKGDRIFRVSYSFDKDGEVELGDETVEVTRVVSYEPVEPKALSAQEVLKANRGRDALFVKVLSSGSIVYVKNGKRYVLRNNGGPGSGNFGHAGRPGEVGGSGGGGGKSSDELDREQERASQKEQEKAVQKELERTAFVVADKILITENLVKSVHRRARDGYDDQGQQDADAEALLRQYTIMDGLVGNEIPAIISKNRDPYRIAEYNDLKDKAEQRMSDIRSILEDIGREDDLP